MKKVIAQHKFKNNKSIKVGICDDINKTDLLFLEFSDKDNITTHGLRPDEAVLIVKLLSELILKRVITYEVNLDKKGELDY